jgi:thioesterase domain-containing protein/acyl carrier protein
VSGIDQNSTIDGKAARAAEAMSREIAVLFSTVFEREFVGTDDDFFRLGGDSILAESLVLAIEERFGSSLSVSTLLEASTPRALANVVLKDFRAETGDCLIPIRKEGSGPPLFCLHGRNGNITYGQSLKTVFGTGRPIYAIRARGLLDGETPPASIEECAADYIREIRRVRRHGPYLLLAPCGPSMIAYEMAQQLTAAGEKVCGLVLADPDDGWVRDAGLARALIQNRQSRRAANAVALAGRTKATQRADAVYKAFGAAVRAYSPKRYRGSPVLLVHSEEWGKRLLDPARGLPSLVADLRSVAVSDSHTELSATFRGKPAQAIRAFLDQVAPLSGPSA